jgi:Stage II sporulation protein E (SpoIIE)
LCPFTVAGMTDEPPARLDAESLSAAIRRLLQAAHHVAPDRLAVLAATVAARCGVTGLWIWLADHEQRSLVRITQGDVTEELEFGGGRIDLETSVGGRAYVSSKPLEVARDGGVMMWLPLMDGVDRIGVLQVQVADVDATARELLASLASVIAAEVTTRGAYGDVFIRARRRQGMGVAAEVIFQLLPPPTFATGDVTIAGALEPAYQVGGDVFDFALNSPKLHVAIFDAVGHGLASSLVATLAINSYRNARRAGAALIDTYQWVDGLIAERFTDNTFVTGHLAELDTATGELHWVNAGHPPPLLVRAEHVIRPLESPLRPPFGLGSLARHRRPLVAAQQLQPGDKVFFYTDGVVEARTSQGVDFGLERLVEFLERAEATGLPPAEVLRRLSHAVVDHHGGTLRDDAATLLVGWHPRLE